MGYNGGIGNGLAPRDHMYQTGQRFALGDFWDDARVVLKEGTDAFVTVYNTVKGRPVPSTPVVTPRAPSSTIGGIPTWVVVGGLGVLAVVMLSGGSRRRRRR